MSIAYKILLSSEDTLALALRCYSGRSGPKKSLTLSFLDGSKIYFNGASVVSVSN